MRALVTGGAGFIGSHVVDGLLDAGAEVTVLDDLSTGRESNLAGALARGARHVVGDVRDGAVVERALGEARAEAVLHLAAQIDVRRSVADPAFDAEVNVVGTATLLEAARRAGVERFVLSSTGGGLYGDAGVIPTPEHAPVTPLAPYGQSKHAAEGLVRLYGRLHGMRIACLRYGNVYGPRQDPLGEGGVVAIFCARALEGGEPVVFGDGGQTRDYVYVGDVAEANLAALDRPVPEPLNVGTGSETSVLELLDHLRALRPEAALSPRFAPERLGEVRRSCLDASRAAEVLGWRARTPLREGLARTLGSQAA